MDSNIESEFQECASALSKAGQLLHHRGWVPATSGNLSARLSNGDIIITLSGCHKGELGTRDFTRINKKGQPYGTALPSAETALHVLIYEYYPTVHSVLHPHSHSSVVVSRLFKKEVILEQYELLKALSGINTHDARIVVPIFPNDQDIPRLAALVAHYFTILETTCYAYLIEGHGLYTWGATVSEALRHLEALEYLFTLETRLHGVIFS